MILADSSVRIDFFRGSATRISVGPDGVPGQEAVGIDPGPTGVRQDFAKVPALEPARDAFNALEPIPITGSALRRVARQHPFACTRRMAARGGGGRRDGATPSARTNRAHLAVTPSPHTSPLPCGPRA